MKNIRSFTDFVGGVNEEAEGSMYKSKLQDIISNAQKILDIIGDEEDLEAWIQDKITIADHNMEAIHGYYTAEKPKDKKMPLDIKGDMATGAMLKDEE